MTLCAKIVAFVVAMIHPGKLPRRPNLDNQR